MADLVIEGMGYTRNNVLDRQRGVLPRRRVGHANFPPLGRATRRIAATTGGIPLNDKTRGANNHAA